MQSNTESRGHKDNLKWLILSASLLGILYSLLPLEVMIDLSTRISPTGTLKDKTILLLRMLAIVLPCLSILVIVWLNIPYRKRQAVAWSASRAADSWWIIPAILVLATALRLGWISVFPTQLYADSNWYFEKGSEIAQGYSYVYDLVTLKPTAAWPVGYPAFLALLYLLTGPSILIAKLANVALSVLLVYLTYLLGRRIFNRLVAVISALLMALLPGIVVYSSLVCSDILFATLFALVLVLTLDKREREAQLSGSKASLLALFVGLANGTMILTRSVGLALLPLWILVRWLVDRHNPVRLRRWTLAMCIGTGLVFVPWTVRNYIRFDKLVLVSTNGGANFWIGNNHLAYGGFIWPRDLPNNPLLQFVGDEIAMDELGYELGLQFIREHPIQALRLLPAKAFYQLNSNDFGLHWNRLSALSAVQWGTGIWAFALTNVVYVVLAAAALLGIIVLLMQRKAYAAEAFVGVGFCVFLTIAYLPFFGQDRFSLPLLPFLAIYAAFGLSSILTVGEFED